MDPYDWASDVEDEENDESFTEYILDKIEY